MTPRTVSAFANDLSILRSELAELGGQAEDQLANALDALSRRDFGLAEEVVARDGALDKRATDIEERSLRMLAFRQPLAQDLRETISCLRIASTLERVGDLAKNIARRAQIVPHTGGQRTLHSVEHMGELAQSQLAKSLDAYGAKNINAALELWRRDIELDDLYHSVFRDLITQMMNDREMVEVGAHLMFIAKNLERIGDHTTFIAEMTYYVTIGEAIQHDRPKGAPLSARDLSGAGPAPEGERPARRRRESPGAD